MTIGMSARSIVRLSLSSLSSLQEFRKVLAEVEDDRRVVSCCRLDWDRMLTVLGNGMGWRCNG